MGLVLVISEFYFYFCATCGRIVGEAGLEQMFTNFMGV